MSTAPKGTPAQLEAAACTLKGPPNGWLQSICNAAGWPPRVCARSGCPHHVHTWARHDARHCSGTCRMAELRDRRRSA